MKICVLLIQSVALAAILMTTGCGGGGGVNSAPTPAPAPIPTPTPTPTPIPTPTVYDTEEYRATVGAVSMNALTAYEHGATGAGIKVGVVDTGIDIASDQFLGRVDPSSANVAGGTTYDDEDGHGTAVAFTIAGARNGAGTHGVAFNATLIVARADTPGSCAVTTGEDAGCKFSDPNIAKGIDLAVANGARVINLSLGGDPPSDGVIAALNRATVRGVIVIVAAGNDGNVTKGASPDPFGAGLVDSPAARNLVIIAGSVGANNTRTAGGDAISNFSNRAGSGQEEQFYLGAVGEDVRAPCNDTGACLWSGTSFATPQIAGAAALLAQAFPNLTGAQIVQILLTSARDAGAPGTDAIYGRGVLDLTKAFSPLGATTTATGAPISISASSTLSAPMGDAHIGPLDAIILDGFNRAFALDLARGIHRTGPQATLAGQLTGNQRTLSFYRGSAGFTVTIAPLPSGAPEAMDVLRFNGAASRAEQSRAISGNVTQVLSARSSFAVGFRQNGQGLIAQLAGLVAPAFLVARDPIGNLGFDSRPGASIAVRRQLGRWGLTGTTETGDALILRDRESLVALPYRYDHSPYVSTTFTVDRRVGPLGLSVGASRLAERDTLLGAHFSAGLGSPRATSWFLDITARFDAGTGWVFTTSSRQGWTMADVRKGLDGGGKIRTDAFAAGVSKSGVLGKADRIAFRIAQPLRVRNGRLELMLPTDWTYDDSRVSDYTRERLNLAPTGREIDVEAVYSHTLGPGDMESNLFYRRDPGNFAGLPEDFGAVIRYHLTF